LAIAQVGGANNNSAVNVTTLTATYAPSSGNTVVLILNTSAAIGSLTVKDSANNALTAGPTQGNLVTYYQFNVPAGITGYTATWTTGVQCSIAVEEYSGVGAVNTNFSANHASGTSASDSIVVAIVATNNWIVAGLGSANTLTTSVGNQRQQTTASSARVTLQDNTSATIGNITNTATLTSAAWTAVAIELGGTGSARSEQDVIISINSPTSAFARVEQDVILSINSVTSASARVEQDLLLAVVSNNLLLKVHVKRYITQRRKKPKLKPRWGHFQKASLLAAPIYVTTFSPQPLHRLITYRKKPKLKKHWGFFQNAALLSAPAIFPTHLPPRVFPLRAHQRPKHAHHMARPIRSWGAVGTRRVQPFVFVTC